MLTDIGYSINAIGYLLLLLLLFTSRQSGVAKQLLVVAVLSTVLWSISFISFVQSPITGQSLFIADTLKQAAWLLFLSSCIRAQFNSVLGVLKRPETLIILSVPTAVFIVPFIVKLDATWFSLLQTLLALEVLIILELVYRQSGEQQWEFKPLVLFLGATQLYEFVLYANTIMIGNFDGRFISVRGYVYFILVPFLVLAIRRIKHWGINIFVSRDVVLHSSLLLVTGGYLLIMSLAGYAVNYFGGRWTTTIEIIMFISSAVVLASVFLSNQIRSKIKIFITKHFFANQYDYRVEWVKLTKTLSDPIKDIHDVHHRALHAFMSSIDYDQGILLKMNGEHFDTMAKSNVNELSKAQIKLLHVLVSYCEKTQWVLDLNQFKFRPYDYPGLSISKDEVYTFRFQIVIPIIHDHKIQSVVLLNSVETETISLDWEVKDYLSAVTEQVNTYLSHHEAAKILAENAQFAAFNRMSAFVLHDLKNVLAQIDLILANAEQHKHNPEFIDDTFETLEHTKSRMDNMLRQLTDKNIEQNKHRTPILMSELVSKVINERCQSLLPIPSLTLNAETELLIEHEKVMNVFYHLISNAQQATKDDGFVSVSIDCDKNRNSLLVKVSDSGEGMSESFIQHRLFTPFDTTKGNAGMGIGVYDARSYLDSIDGKLDVESEVGKGTTFTLMFPIS
ncbi:PEP-CTERM system histidine kinase PrsK [Alteromonas sp. 5E99-2]|uniref:XrtA/PEP-CTERM system histidine kinase PrsK n=1 Tax=Alteromonas sp. 5E99-2 TaxID=2817683 RepID=UPI001A99E920|nr:XrtA/PEP-CTERM system histidine kinase PrsK [Alteromonas sp. 5E99-2]MBO1256405.1 PEP-CTERM system histidine kinase PrsK [Alteromonas sp. 5E99-2]